MLPIISYVSSGRACHPTEVYQEALEMSLKCLRKHFKQFITGSKLGSMSILVRPRMGTNVEIRGSGGASWIGQDLFHLLGKRKKQKTGSICVYVSLTTGPVRVYDACDKQLIWIGVRQARSCGQSQSARPHTRRCPGHAFLKTLAARPLWHAFRVLRDYAMIPCVFVVFETATKLWSKPKQTFLLEELKKDGTSKIRQTFRTVNSTRSFKKEWLYGHVYTSYA